MLSGKKILLGVTGSIAAYKAAHIVRALIKSNAEVKVIMTESACDFITPLTLSTLSKKPVAIEFIKDEESGEWENHVDWGIWADLMLIAPCSANTLSKLVNGNCDNLLLATYLSAKCPVWIAPAMDLEGRIAHLQAGLRKVSVRLRGVQAIRLVVAVVGAGIGGQLFAPAAQ